MRTKICLCAFFGAKIKKGCLEGVCKRVLEGCLEGLEGYLEGCLEDLFTSVPTFGTLVKRSSKHPSKAD